MAALLAVFPAAASADPPHVVWVSGVPSAEAQGRARRWQRRVARALERRGVEVTSERETWAYGGDAIELGRIERLSLIAAALRTARRRRAHLDHAGALASLLEAESVALRALDVPGAHAWYAEVQIAIAVAADESGQRALADQALARAASVDPGRAIGAAEAPPDLLARAHAIARAIAAAPRGRFEVSANVPARVFLDGRAIGAAPAWTEASPGVHVLRVEAPGHRPWARRIDVFEGGRPAIEIALAPEPALEAARSLRAASERGDISALEHALAALASLGRAPRALWLVEVSDGALERAIVVPCRPARCEAPILLDVGRVESALPEDPDLAEQELVAGDLSRARDWLEEPVPIEAPPPTAPPWWQEPWPWVIAGIVVAGGIAAGIGAGYQEPAPVIQRDFVPEDGLRWTPAP